MILLINIIFILSESYINYNYFVLMPYKQTLYNHKKFNYLFVRDSIS